MQFQIEFNSGLTAYVTYENWDDLVPPNDVPKPNLGGCRLLLYVQ